MVSSMLSRLMWATIWQRALSRWGAVLDSRRGPAGAGGGGGASPVRADQEGKAGAAAAGGGGGLAEAKASSKRGESRGETTAR